MVKKRGLYGDFWQNKLGAKDGRLAEIQKQRKDSIAIGSEDAKDLIRSFAQNLSRNQDLLQLLGQTLNLDLQTKGNQKGNSNKSKKKKPKKNDMQPFNPQRFPAFFQTTCARKIWKWGGDNADWW